jgi:L-fucose isomerase-like protein
MNNKVLVGLVGLVHPNMPGDDRGVYCNMIQAMESLASKLDFDLVFLPEPLGTEEDGYKAKEFLNEKKVDFTMIANPSFGFGRVMLPLAKVNSYIGSWSIPEPANDGVLQLNSFCGLNMFGAILGNYFSEYDIPYKWFYGYPDSPMFLERFKITLKVMKAIKTVKQSRIGLIGGIANGFENLNFDERILGKKFGAYIQTRHTVEEIVARAQGYSTQQVEATLAEMHQEGRWNKAKVQAGDMDKSARVSMAFLDFAKENNYNALCISCWPRFQEVYGIAVCGAMSRLNEAGIVAPCEGDVPGAINMLIFNALNGQKATIMDLVHFDDQDQSLNMWHCGVAAKCWANQDGLTWDEHFNIGSYVDNQWCGKGVVADLTFRPGKTTIARMDNQFDNLFIMTGDIMEGKKGYSGSTGWINHLQIQGEKISIADLMNTIAVNRLDHHYPMAYGDLNDELIEFANWNKMRLVKSVPYKPYLQIL